MKIRLFGLIALVVLSTVAFAQSPAWAPAPGLVTLKLWPAGAPGAPANAPAEKDSTTPKDNLIAGKPLMRLANVSVPTLTVYPPKGANTGAAVVVFPGGAYWILAMDLEGTEVCDWLSSAGITCVLAKYRVPESGPYPKPAALQDAQRAVGLVRAHAAEWKIDPNRIGVLGFSAGGHLSAAVSTHFEQRIYEPVDEADRLSCRPDFTVLVYPAYLAVPEKDLAPSQEIVVTEKTPPAFIVMTEDDPIHVESAVSYYMQLKKAKVPAEMHLYAEGGHGYGLRENGLPVTTWPKLVETWLKTIGMVGKK